MPRVTVVDQVVEMLAEAGVSRIYGVMGESLHSLADAVRARPGIAWLPLRREAAAVSAAATEAQLTGRLTVCGGNSGLGGLRLLDRLHHAHRGHVPLLAIAMHASTRDIGMGDDEVRPESLFRQCSCFCELVSHSHQMPRLLRRAVETAVTRPGVAVLVLPADVALRGATMAEPSQALRSCVSISNPSSAARLIGTLMTAGDTVTCDAVASAFWQRLSNATRQLPRSVVVSSPDTGLSAALGAQLSHTDRLVFALVDDTALATLAGDLCSLLQFRAPVKVIVIRNGPKMASASEGTFAMVAEATGVPGLVARTARDAGLALDRAIAHQGPALVEVSSKLVRRVGEPCSR